MLDINFVKIDTRLLRSSSEIMLTLGIKSKRYSLQHLRCRPQCSSGHCRKSLSCVCKCSVKIWRNFTSSFSSLLRFATADSLSLKVVHSIGFACASFPTRLKAIHLNYMKILLMIADLPERRLLR